MNRRTRDRKLLGILAAFLTGEIVGIVLTALFDVNGLAAAIPLVSVVAVIGAAVYTVVFNGPRAFWNMVTGQKETQ
jgi:hypothetical protein